MHTHLLTLLILSLCVALSHNTSIFRDRQKTLTKEKEKDPDSGNLIKVSIGAILPFSSFKHITRLYDMSLNTSRFTKYRSGYTFTKVYSLQTPRETLALSASPRTVLETLCDRILPHNVSAIMYMTNAQLYGSNAATAQYMLQLTGYLGLPVIAWNVDNVGLEQRVSDSRILQLAPTVEHQARVMLSILVRYSWHTFSVVTSQIGGHDDFIRAVRDLLQRGFSTSPFSHDSYKFDILNVISLKSDTKEGYKNELELIADSEARIFLLFATRMEAVNIMAAAKELGITGKHYVWIASQSVVGSEFEIKTRQFPTGMLGLYVNVTNERLYMEMERAVNIFAHGLESFHKDTKKGNTKLSPQLSCNETGMARWHRGDVLFKHMRSDIFNLDGTLKDVEILVMNLKHIRWEQIGVWSGGNLSIRDIVWPGNSPVPPPGVPEKFNLKITFLKEPPYVNLLPPDNETGECKTSRSVRCRVAPEEKLLGMNHTEAVRNPEFYKCCSGFCIDLLQKFSQDLKFTYDLYQVEDGAWGVVNKGTWNGLIAEVLNNKADIVVTSIKINSDRQTVVDFTVPFLETGIAIVVAKRTGIISPKAFLEPFDTISWLMILLVCIQGAALAIFVFEWLSPYGYDMKMVPPREDTNGPDHKFSLFRTYWLVWAILFGAAVNVDCPRGYTARFMSSVWSMFAVVFLAIYTANLAAFMITREEYYDLTGIDDKRLQNPHSVEPPFRYGTIPYGNTEAILRKNKEHLFDWMRKFNRSSVIKGVAAVKTGELDAFIYDATVLEYLAGQDNECRLLTVGSWYAMTGYGFALSKHSKYLSMFNRWMIKYRENGDLERLQRFWLQGACKPKHKKRNVSKPLDVNQFMSAFLLLGGGVLFTIMVLLLEHIYFKYIRQHLEKTDKGGCLTLISLSMGKSLNFRGAVQEATDIIIHHKCKNPICDTTLRKIRHDLRLAQLKIEELTAMNNMMGGSIAPTNHEFKKTEPLKTRDLTHNMIMSTETGEPGYKSDYTEAYGPHFIKTSMTPAHVAEIETVL